MKTQLESAWSDLFLMFTRPAGEAWRIYERKFGSLEPLTLQKIADYLIDNHVRKTFPTIAEIKKAMTEISAFAPRIADVKHESWDRHYEQAPVNDFTIYAMQKGFIGSALDDHLNHQLIEQRKEHDYREKQKKYIAAIRSVIANPKKTSIDKTLLEIAKTMQERLTLFVSKNYHQADRDAVLQKYQTLNSEIQNALASIS